MTVVPFFVLADVAQRLKRNFLFTFLKSEKPSANLLASDKGHFDALSLGRGSRGREINTETDVSFDSRVIPTTRSTLL